MRDKMREALLGQKLGNIISDYRINPDDADWLRGLLSSQPAQVPDSEQKMLMANAIIAKHFHNDPAGACRAQAAVQEILAEQPAQGEALCRSDGRCQYAIDHGAEGLGHCPKGRCAMPVAHGEAVGRFEHGMTRALNAGDWPPSSQAIIADLINRRAARPADPPAPAVPDDAAKLRELLRRYRTEVPLGHQPHMIADEVDAILAAAPEITK